MGVLSKDMCQVYKLLFGNEIRTNGIARFYEADPIPAIFYFINSAIFYRVLFAFKVTNIKRDCSCNAVYPLYCLYCNQSLFILSSNAKESYIDSL